MRSDRGLDSVIHSRRTSLIHHHWPQARTACVQHSVVSVSMQQLEPRGGAYYSGNSLGVWRISYSHHRSTPMMVVVVMVKAMVRVRKLQDWNNANSNPMVSVSVSHRSSASSSNHSLRLQLQPTMHGSMVYGGIRRVCRRCRRCRRSMVTIVRDSFEHARSHSMRTRPSSDHHRRRRVRRRSRVNFDRMVSVRTSRKRLDRIVYYRSMVVLGRVE